MRRQSRQRRRGTPQPGRHPHLRHRLRPHRRQRQHLARHRPAGRDRRSDLPAEQARPDRPAQQPVQPDPRGDGGLRLRRGADRAGRHRRQGLPVELHSAEPGGGLARTSGLLPEAPAAGCQRLAGPLRALPARLGRGRVLRLGRRRFAARLGRRDRLQPRGHAQPGAALRRHRPLRQHDAQDRQRRRPAPGLLRGARQHDGGQAAVVPLSGRRDRAARVRVRLEPDDARSGSAGQSQHHRRDRRIHPEAEAGRDRHQQHADESGRRRPHPVRDGRHLPLQPGGAQRAGELRLLHQGPVLEHTSVRRRPGDDPAARTADLLRLVLEQEPLPPGHALRRFGRRPAPRLRRWHLPRQRVQAGSAADSA